MVEIKRDKYLNAMLECRQNGQVKVITGLRRVGKSYLLFKLFKGRLLQEGIADDHIIEMAFDDFANREYRDPKKLYFYVKSKIVDKNMYYILLDEVQMLDDFVNVLNGFLHIDNVDVYITGSNAKFLSKDIVTEFHGRGTQIYVSPLSYQEYNAVCKGDRYDNLQKYILYGGLPIVVLAESEGRKAFLLGELIRETYISDIVMRNRVRGEAELNELFRVLASNIGSLTNPTKISNTFKSDKHIDLKSDTISRYIEYFKDSFLLEKTMRYDTKGRKYIGTPHKY